MAVLCSRICRYRSRSGPAFWSRVRTKLPAWRCSGRRPASRIAGSGRIIRPGADDILFLAQRPYLPPGTLRQVLEDAPRAERNISDDRILRAAARAEPRTDLGPGRRAGLEQDWRTLLSLREQQLLALSIFFSRRRSSLPRSGRHGVGFRPGPQNLADAFRELDHLHQ